MDLIKFKSHKIVHAKPMTRGEYDEYQKTVLSTAVTPAGDLSDDGYLVIYSMTTMDHYESWSPKKQFEEGHSVVLQDNSENKVPFERIEALAKNLEYKFERVGDTTVTGCWSFLPNGFQVGYGESACVDPANYKREDGEKYARERCEADSKNKLWQFEGYALMQKLTPI